MQIFISWSGDMAKQCAEALRDWLPYMNQAITPFVSSQDISKGERGLSKIADQLQECSFGIVCVTRENQSAPWINFEAGALSRELGESFLIPFLIDMQVKDLSSGPLTQFQATDSSNKADVWAMVKVINDKCDATVEAERLRRTFDRWWQDLESQMASIRKANPSADAPQRDVAEILDELVKLVRDQHARLGSLEKVVGNSGSTHYTINEPSEVRISAQGTVSSSADASRIRRAIHMARELIGVEHVANVKRQGSSAISIFCTDEGVVRARAARKTLQELAATYNIGIEIRTANGNLVDGHAPF